jgi:hypothetical protein
MNLETHVLQGRVLNWKAGLTRVQKGQVLLRVRNFSRKTSTVVRALIPKVTLIEHFELQQMESFSGALVRDSS